LAEWRSSRPGRAVGFAPLLAVDALEEAPSTPLPAGPTRPLDGVRVLDLTRVVAGPVCGRFLAAYGADVLRVDGPAAEDSPALVADTTVGKRSAILDLRAPGDREVFERLVAEADVVLQAYRPEALDRLGYGPPALAELRPGLVVASLSAYGGVGPWRTRRGFDSLVQFATGIADEGRAATGTDAPVSLPVQALDHATGYLLAAGVATALHRRTTGGGAWHVRASLARTAHWLDALGRTDASVSAPPAPTEESMVELSGPLGRTLHLRPPGALDGYSPEWSSPPRPLGYDAPAWPSRSAR
ncbi:MAG TPA: CoA transferase, partial [Cryptosporangiaceae bacterium]|nr:CoA transferase [Cryptosporangiaceae bacterium]